MHQRERERKRKPVQGRPGSPLPRSDADAVLALQRSIGNQSTTQVLARDNKKAKDKNRPSFPHSVKIPGKIGTIEIKGGNIAEWAAKKTPDGLVIVSPKGKHSEELKRLFDGKTKLETVETNSVVGENTLVTIVFKDCRIVRYSQEGDTDEWTVEFQGAARQSLSIGSAR
jgi:hypothetical protein